jgi:hypothetical protein
MRYEIGLRGNTHPLQIPPHLVRCSPYSFVNVPYFILLKMNGCVEVGPEPNAVASPRYSGCDHDRHEGIAGVELILMSFQKPLQDSTPTDCRAPRKFSWLS